MTVSSMASATRVFSFFTLTCTIPLGGGAAILELQASEPHRSWNTSPPAKGHQMRPAAGELPSH